MKTPGELYPLRSADGEINDALTPHEIIERIVLDGVSPARAWREYLRLTQTQEAGQARHLLPDLFRAGVAKRPVGIRAYLNWNALGVNPELLDCTEFGFTNDVVSNDRPPPRLGRSHLPPKASQADRWIFDIFTEYCL